MMLALLALAAAVAGDAAPAPTTREMERINWMEFRESVPARIETVLLPLGTLEARKGRAIRASTPRGRRSTSTR